METIITKATEVELGDFGEKNWHAEDMAHYGEPVEWVEEEFIFKATQNGELVGTIHAKFEAGVVFIHTLIVPQNHRRQGIGKMLLEATEKYGKALGAHKIFLFTMEKWEAAKFYQRLGYEKTGDLPQHYLKRDFVIYSKFI